MKEHNWISRLIDGGHVGSYDIWFCSICGACRGPVVFADRTPFLPGPALKLSNNCDIAIEEIRNHVNSRISGLEQKSSKGISPKYPTLLRNLIAQNPQITDITPIMSIIYEIENFRQRPTLEEIEASLLVFGFILK